MGKTKRYMIVTNDEIEIPVASDLIGAKQVAERLGISEQCVRNNLHRNQWKGDYKVEVIGVVEIDRVQKQRDRCKRYSMTHDRTEYFKELYQKKKRRESYGDICENDYGGEVIKHLKEVWNDKA